MQRRCAWRDERGETLLELLITLVVVGITVIAVSATITSALILTGTHRKQATATTILRNYAEAVETAVNTTPTTGYRTGANATPVGYTSAITFAAPATYAASVILVECRIADGTWATCTNANDIGIQRLTLQVASNDSASPSGSGRGAIERLVVVIRTPCTALNAACS